MWILMKLGVLAFLLCRGTEATCKYEFNVPDGGFQCSANSRELASSVNRIEARQNINEGRQHSIADAFKTELSTLAEDTKSAKQVINRLVEDGVSLQGKLHVLQDVGSEVRGLRGQVLNISHDLAGRVSGLQSRVLDIVHNLDQSNSGQVLVTAKLSTDMLHNKGRLGELSHKLDTQTASIARLEAKVATVERGLAERPATPSYVEDLQGMVTELTSRVEALTTRVNQRH